LICLIWLLMGENFAQSLLTANWIFLILDLITNGGKFCPVIIDGQLNFPDTSQHHQMTSFMCIIFLQKKISMTQQK
jgi:hypothetical protein